MSDVLIYQTDDDGEITITNGELLMTDGPESAIYLSLFGGNEDDPGLSDATLEWWGNLVGTSAAGKYRSRTQYLLQSLPPTSSNLLRIQDAVSADLAWMVDDLGAVIEVSASIPALNRIRIDLSVDLDGQRYSPGYVMSWSQ